MLTVCHTAQINEIIFKKIDSSSKKLMGGFFQVFF